MFSKDQGSGGFRCTVCGLNSGSTPSTIKSHYVKDHGVSITVTTKTLVPRSRRSVSPSAQSLQTVEDIDMEDDNPRPKFGAPSNLIGENAGHTDLDTDEEDEQEDEWEEDSTLSEMSGEGLLEEDEDDVVPASFSLSPATQPSNDDDCSTTDGGPADPPAHMLENEAPDPKIVYGSNSKYTH